MKQEFNYPLFVSLIGKVIGVTCQHEQRDLFIVRFCFRYRFLLHLLLNSTILVNIASAQSNFWIPTNGPYGGIIHCITVSADMIYIGTSYGVYKSAVSLLSWKEVNIGLTPDDVYSLALDQGNNIFAATYSGVFRSTDDGANWTRLNNGIGTNPSSLISIGPNGNIFSGSALGIHKSTDSGDSWIQVFNNSGVTSIEVKSNGHIFAGTSLGVFRSTDNGNSWVLQNITLSGFATTCLTVDASENILAGTYGSDVIFRTTDEGLNWERIETGTGVSGFNSFVLNSQGDLFAGAYDVYQTGVAGHGVYRSTDNGTTWIQVSNGFKNLDVQALAIDSTGRLLAGTFGDGVYNSTNNGLNWIQGNFGLQNCYVRDIVTKSNGDIFVATNGSGVHRSTDGGNSWTQLYEPMFSPYTLSLCIDSSQNIYVGTMRLRVFESEDNATSWNQIGFSGPAHFLEYDSPTGLWASDGSTIYQYQGGYNWSGKFSAANSILFDTIRFYNGTHWDKTSYYIFRPTIDGVYRSIADVPCMNQTDCGPPGISASFYKMDSGLGNTEISSLIATPDHKLYAGGISGVYRSTIDGTTWEQINGGLNNSKVQILKINNFGDIFAGTNNGVYQLSNGSNTWFQINSGLTRTIINSLVVAPDGHLYSGSHQGGLFRSTQPNTNVNEHSTQPIFYSLEQNYPNPFNPNTKISYSVSKSSYVSLIIYDLLGREVVKLVQENKQPGEHIINWKAEGVPSGVYFYRLTSEKNVQTKKMILLK